MKPTKLAKLALSAVILTTFLFGNISYAALKKSKEALIIIGSSYANGTTRIDDKQNAVLFGLAVGSGGYLSLGDAIVREKKFNGLVVNEANVGTTTFGRFSCSEHECLSFGKLFGYETQFNNALKRTAIYDSVILGQINGYNAKYIIIGVSNDCIHSDSFGVPQTEARPCSIDEINESADRIIKIARKAEQLGMTAIISLLPKYESLDLILMQQGLGLQWVVDEQQYNEIRYFLKLRLESELKNSLIVDLWKKFEHRGDGIHPNKKTVKRAARKIAKIIGKNDRLQRRRAGYSSN